MARSKSSDLVFHRRGRGREVHRASHHVNPCELLFRLGEAVVRASQVLNRGNYGEETIGAA